MALVGCLDTRFYFAHAQDEASWTRKVVNEASHRGSLIVSSTITIAELVSAMGTTAGLETTQLRVNSARLAGVNFIPLSEKIASKAGEMILKNSDLPLADAVIAATALDLTRGRVYTDDPHFQKITGIHVVWGRT
ncbi:type II toxin-antitoxin system VapC family toxin [Candidatus Bathyarchaeota archaeon]|nr:MAG: type II toxin-antitoxin system VapC family toxin [Candidatus Bathyarchaeota archaeon]